MNRFLDSLSKRLYQPCATRRGDLTQQDDLLSGLGLAVADSSTGDVSCAVETQRQLGSRLRNHL